MYLYYIVKKLVVHFNVDISINYGYYKNSFVSNAIGIYSYVIKYIFIDIVFKCPQPEFAHINKLFRKILS